jgi:cytoskeletal protein CcmA (bactofilin family)
MFGRDKDKNNNANQSSAATSSAAASAPMQPPPAPVPSMPKIETVIGPNCRVTGKLESDGGIRIEGIFEGTIETTGNLVVAESATVLAEIRAYNCSVSGSVKGNITANKVEITDTGKVWGDLSINSLLLHEGAYLKGQTNMGGNLEPPAIEPPRITTAARQLDSGSIIPPGEGGK